MRIIDLQFDLKFWCGKLLFVQILLCTCTMHRPILADAIY